MHGADGLVKMTYKKLEIRLYPNLEFQLLFGNFDPSDRVIYGIRKILGETLK